MKETVKKWLQQLLGFDRYLRIFAKFKIATLRSDKKEGDFFHFMTLVKDEGLVLDIGANLGIMTAHLAKKFKRAEIWAFEPIPDNLRVLKSVISSLSNRNIKIFELALGEKPGRTKMVLPEVEEVQMQGLSHVVHDSITEFNDGRFFEVEVETLDRIIPSNQSVSGIKLDVENFEYFVLKGGEKVIEKYHPIIYTELWDNENRGKCMNFLTQKGYTPMYFDGGKLQPFIGSAYTGQNFFFVPSED